MAKSQLSGLDQSAFSSLADDWRTPTLFKCSLSTYFLTHFCFTIVLSPGIPVAHGIHPYLALFAAQTVVAALGMRGIFKEDRHFIKYFILAMIYLVLLQWIVAALSFVDGYIFFGVLLVIYSGFQFALLIMLLVFKLRPAPKWMLYVWPFNDKGIKVGPLTGGDYDNEAVTTAFGSSSAGPFAPTNPGDTEASSTTNNTVITTGDGPTTEFSAATISNPTSKVPSVNFLDDSTQLEKPPPATSQTGSSHTCSCTDVTANCSFCQGMDNSRRGSQAENPNVSLKPVDEINVTLNSADEGNKNGSQDLKPRLQQVPMVPHVKTPMRGDHTKSRQSRT